jgi:hypothetical protein
VTMEMVPMITVAMAISGAVKNRDRRRLSTSDQ